MNKIDENSVCTVAVCGEKAGQQIVAPLKEIIILLEKYSKIINGTGLNKFFTELVTRKEVKADTFFDVTTEDLIYISIGDEDILHIDRETSEINTIEDFEQAPSFKELSKKKNIENIITFLKSILLYKTITTVKILNKTITVGIGSSSQTPADLILITEEKTRYWLKYDNDWLRLSDSQKSAEEILTQLTNSESLDVLEERIVTLLG